ncbi:hypothetical protein [Streptomyces sp. CBMA152]|uniref:hypothetical protein n=1 Tax=Streptomyces sp. CBMA152 TaxID=1896312 RepID=UPI0016600841|nr:hypothetical protein [Streptomyces sp. CBMA152]MBD0745400.1 hypothetical protein [Streptomyces sp. CBMA152]
MSDQRTEATRQLMAGVHLDARFRDAVIDELYEHPARVAAPAYDFDAVPVLVEAFRARRLARLWALPTALLWITGFVLLGWLFAVYAVGASALFGAARVLGDRASPLPTAVVARRPPPTRGARLWGGALRGFGRLTLVGYATLVVALSGVDGPRVWGVAPFVAAIPLTAMMVVVTGFHRRSVVRQLTGIQSHPPSSRGPGATLAELGPTISQITRTQASRMVVHPPGDPFVGSGTALHAECVTTRLRPSDRPDVERFVARRILDVVGASVARVSALAQQVDNCLFLSEDVAPPPSRLYDSRDLDRLHDSALGGSGPGIRLLRIVCRGPRSQLTTVFVRVRLVNPYLSVELHTYVLPPVRPDFAAAGRPGEGWQSSGHPFVPRSEGRSLALAFLRTPSAGAGALAELAVWPVRRLRALSLLDSLGVTGPRVSIRELAAERELSEPELLDSHRIAGIVRQLVLDTVRAELAALGLSAPGLTDREHESYESRGGIQIQIGNITPGNMATGSSARATGPLRHTSPGPTTNPDDDSWDDDLG